MGVISDAAVSKGDIARRLDQIEEQLRQLRTARRLEAASVGRGGLRIRGGRLTIQDTAGDDMFRAGGDPGELFLREDLLEPLARQIIAETHHFDKVATSQTLADQATFTDLATTGPRVTGVKVIVGVAIVHLSCWMSGTLPAGTGSFTGYMGVDTAGPTDVAATINEAQALLSVNHNAGGTNRTEAGRFATTVIVPDLDPGTYTFTAKYRTSSGSPTTVTFQDRSMVVIAF